MNMNKVINILNAAKANNGLSREEIERICGKETDAVLAFIRNSGVCTMGIRDRIIHVDDGKFALLLDELKQKKKSKFSGVIKLVMENIIAPLIKS